MNDNELIEAVRAKLALAQLHMRSSVNGKYPVVNVIGARSAIATATDLLSRLEVLSTPEPEPNDTDLLVEALARSQALDWILGDPAGSHPNYDTAVRQARWITAVSVYPTNWNLNQGELDDADEDPLTVRRAALDEAVMERAILLRQRVRGEEAAYQPRVEANRVSRRDGEDKK